MTKKQGIMTPLGIDKAAEWCNNFMLGPNPNGKVKLCLDPARLNQALIRSVHRESTHYDILPKLNNTKYLSLIDVMSCYHNLKIDERSSYVTTFTCQFGK